MNSQQSLQDLMSASNVEINLVNVLFNLFVAAVLGYMLRYLYIRYGRSLSNRRSFAANFVILACTTTLIITVVKSSLALSLGLVGALSIVRFRSAIKEPEELAYLFLTIAIGLGLGADQFKITVPAFALIAVLIVVGSLSETARKGANLFLTISADSPVRAELGTVAEVLKQHCASVALRRFDESADGMEAAFQVEVDDFQHLEDARAQLRALNEAVQISLVDNRGIV